MIPEILSTQNKPLDSSQPINHSKQSNTNPSKMTINTRPGGIKLANIHNDGYENTDYRKQEIYFGEQILKNTINQQSILKKHPSSLKFNNAQNVKQENISTEKGQQRIENRESSHGKYSNKIQNFHLQEASTIRPSIFQEDNNQHFSQAKPLQIKNHKEEQYNPSNTKNRNHHLKSGDIRYKQAIPSLKKADEIIETNHSKSMEKKRIRKLPSIANKSNNFLSLHQSSNIKLKSAEDKNNFHLFNDHLIQPEKAVFTQFNSTQYFDFFRQKKCGINYCYPSYTIEKQGVIVTAAQKQACSINSIYLIKSGQNNEMDGYLKGNFSGTQFNLYKNNSERNTQELVCTIIYQVNCLWGPSFRRSEVYINNSKNNAMFQGQTKRNNLKTLYELGYTAQIYKLKTKQPTWNENQKCYTMNFGGKGKIASIKNMILIPELNDQRKKLLFCKISENRFYIEAENPLNLFIIMGILMSSFDFKLLCQ